MKDSILKQVCAMKKRAEGDKGWYKLSKEAVKLYEATKDNDEGSQSDDPYYNILFPNTEILLAATFSANPVPVAKARRRNPTPIDAAVAQLIEQVLAYQLDPNNQDQPSFYEQIESDVLDAVTAGVGEVVVRYEIERGPEVPAVDPSTMTPLQGPDGKPIMQPGPILKECVYPYHIGWNRIWWSPARKWQDVTWVALGFDTPLSELEKQYPNAKEVISQVKEKLKNSGDSEKVSDHVVLMIQVWNKTNKTVGVFCDMCEDEWLSEPEPSPFDLPGFFPMPKPLFYVKKSNSLTPTPVYKYYKRQAEELEVITERLRKVVNAIKVRGVHSNIATEFANLLDRDLDNTFISADNPQLMMENGGLDKHIWVWPIEKLVTVAQSLYQQREQCKQVIYEITGMGDIMRSSTAASESATAQRIKDKWGGMRLQRFKSAAQTHIRDVLRLMLEISAQKLSDETLASIAGAQIPPEILDAFRKATSRYYSVDVETDSTVAALDEEEKKEVAEFMTAFGQMMAGMQTLAGAGPTGIEAGKQILLAATSRFRFGRQVESAIRQIKYEPPQSPEAPPEAPKGLTPEELELERYRIDQENLTRLQVADKQAQAQVQVALIARESRKEQAAARPALPPSRTPR